MMHIKKLCIFIFFIMIMPFAYADSSDIALVQKNILTMSRCWSQQDMHCATSYYMNSSKTVYISGTTPYRGYQKIINQYKSRFPNDMGKLTLTPFYARVLSDHSILTVMKFDLSYQEKNYLGTSTLIWQKNSKGQWKIIFDHSVGS